MVQDWVCYSAPITDPATGLRVGVLDLSTTFRRANPLALSTVSAMARNLEFVLGAAPQAPPAAGAASLHLQLLGTAEVRLDDRVLSLPPRQIELLAVLSLQTGGLSLEQLHDRVHGDRPAAPGTTKAELSHLRRVVGLHLANRPYRLDGAWTADHAELRSALRGGRVDDALALYRGPLLPRSSSPLVEEHRHAIDVAIRTAVLTAPTRARVLSLLAITPDDPFLVELAADPGL
jgi:hypothetical protein